MNKAQTQPAQEIHSTLMAAHDIEAELKALQKRIARIRAQPTNAANLSHLTAALAVDNSLSALRMSYGHLKAMFEQALADETAQEVA